MPGCITQDYKDLLVGMISTDVTMDILSAVVKGVPLCAAPTTATAEGARAARKVPEPWGIKPVYVDAKGKKTTYDSPSSLVKELGLKMSGIQCDAEGKVCKASSAIDILRIAGYTVSGNGEPRKAAQGGEKLTVIHPDAVKEK